MTTWIIPPKQVTYYVLTLNERYLGSISDRLMWTDKEHRFLFRREKQVIPYRNLYGGSRIETTSSPVGKLYGVGIKRKEKSKVDTHKY